MTFSELIRDFLATNQMTQGQLARELGVTQPWISQIIAGGRTPGPDLIERFHKVSGYTVDYLHAASGRLPPSLTGISAPALDTIVTHYKFVIDY